LPERITNDEDIKDSTKNYDIGIVVGVGFEIKIKLISLFIEVRYHQGTINIMPKNYLPESMKTRSEVILFGLKIK